MSNENTNALGAQAAHVGAVLLIAALDGIALLKQDLGNGAHADAANPDDMESPDLTGHLHGRRSPGPILLLTKADSFVAGSWRQLRSAVALPHNQLVHEVGQSHRRIGPSHTLGNRGRCGKFT